MMLATWEGSASTPPGVLLLFGSGLIGGSIADAFRRDFGARCVTLGWRWPVPDDGQLHAILEAVRRARVSFPKARLSTVWAAGRGGFGTSEAGMADEFDALAQVRRISGRVGEGLPAERHAFVLLSSAGGLFEGQTAVGHDTLPAPIRPYGRGKLAQERAVREELGLGTRLILRPSSVYGHVPGGRLGLVSALIRSEIFKREATIFGALTTLRDYVYAPDIGRYIGQRLIGPWRGSPDSVETEFLVAGRPASVFEIIKVVESRFDSTLRLRIDPRPENARDNTFRAETRPPGFRPMGLVEGVALTTARMMADPGMPRCA